MSLEISDSVSAKFRNMSILCAFLVVIIHCRPVFEKGCLSWWVKEVLENGVCEIAVPFFFLASGFFVVLKIQGGGYKDGIIKRMRTLLLPYGFWILMYLLFNMLLKSRLIIPLPRTIGLNPFVCPVLSPLWYVRALICLVVISPLILRGLKKSSTVTLLAMLFLYGAICPYSPMPHWDRLKDLARIGPIPVCGLFYFAAGMAIRLGSLNGIIKQVRKVQSIAWVALGLALVVVRAIVIDIGFELLGAYCGFASIPFLLVGFWRIVPSQRGLNWLVLSSFPVYVIHKFFYPIVGWFVDKNTLYGYVLSFASVFVLSLLATSIIRSISPKISAVVFGGR